MLQNHILVPFVLLISLLLCGGCAKKEEEKSKCIRGELSMTVRFSQDLKASDASDRWDCPTRLSTSGAAPPVDAWGGGAEPHWDPLLIVRLNKKKTEPLRKGDEDKCVYTWEQNCAGE